MRIQTLAVAAALLACAAPRAAHASGADAARSGPYSLELVDERGRVLPTFEHRGRTYVLGARGQRYLVRVRNQSARAIEAVASVDGRDVVDGRPAALEKRGYVVEPYGEVTIDGFRLGQESVAAFRFGSVARSYAARTGDARDVGVVGVAIFPERSRPYARPYRPYDPYPYPDPYPRPYPGDGAEPYRGDDAPSAAAPEGSAKAPSPGPGAQAKRGADAWASRPGLGTEFGEVRDSPVREVGFERASSRPQTVLTLRYDDRRGLVALGIEVDRWYYAGTPDAWLRETARPFRQDVGFSEPPPGWNGR
jgi:hypothetical protein